MNKKLIVSYAIIIALIMTPVVVFGDVPTVLSVTRKTAGSDLLIEIKVRHSNPSSSHFIEKINVDLDGTIKAFTSLEQPTTTEATFILNLGAINPKSIKAQAVCNLHGPSSYVSEVGTQPTGGGTGGIPAYGFETIFLGLLLTSIILYAYTKKRNHPFF